jgi:peroxiredoxin 2/4
MKRLSSLILALCAFSQTVCSDEPLLVGSKAPLFNSHAVINGQIEEFSLESLRGKYVVLLFYPLDFTFVCPTELHAFQDKLDEFTQRNAQVVGVSVDSAFTHLAWLNTPAAAGGIQGVTYPLVSDLNKTISSQFHVLNPTGGVAYRGLFILDREGVVRHMLVNDLPLGRSVDEALRTLDALITHEELGDVCPANWKKGAKTMKPTSQGLVDYFGDK